jgi:hypothetical protein
MASSRGEKKLIALVFAGEAAMHQSKVSPSRAIPYDVGGRQNDSYASDEDTTRLHELTIN